MASDSTDDDLHYWFPVAWTVIGVVLSFVSLIQTFRGTSKRPTSPTPPPVPDDTLEATKDLLSTLRRSRLETLATNVEKLVKAVVPPGEPTAETTLGLAVRSAALLQDTRSVALQTRGKVQQLMMEQQTLQSAVLEVGAQIRESMKAKTKIQRGAGHLSLVNSLGKRSTEDLVRARIEAMFPSLYQDLD